MVLSGAPTVDFTAAPQDSGPVNPAGEPLHCGRRRKRIDCSAMMDCVIIGAGPAGLTAAIYLGRFRRNFRVIDAGDSRARRIPKSHNVGGYADGISGEELMARLLDHATRYGARIDRQDVIALRAERAGFAIRTNAHEIFTRTVILATGVADIPLPLPNLADAIGAQLVRYCPICDGYEARGLRIGVIGRGASGLQEALFLRTYAEDLTLLSLGSEMRLAAKEKAALARSGIKAIETPVAEIRTGARSVLVGTADGWIEFDTLYSALGVEPRSALARAAGAALTAEGCVLVDKHMRTNVSGLYAIGDVIEGLDQINAAIGHASIAATAVHNQLLDAGD
jgi:thioredoxin reductase (NADPH)